MCVPFTLSHTFQCQPMPNHGMREYMPTSKRKKNFCDDDDHHRVGTVKPTETKRNECKCHRWMVSVCLAFFLSMVNSISFSLIWIITLDYLNYTSLSLFAHISRAHGEANCYRRQHHGFSKFIISLNYSCGDEKDYNNVACARSRSFAFLSSESWKCNTFCITS